MAMIGGKTYRKLGLKIVNITDLKISRNDFNDFFLMKLNIEILIVEHKKFLNSKLPSRLHIEVHSKDSLDQLIQNKEGKRTVELIFNVLKNK